MNIHLKRGLVAFVIALTMALPLLFDETGNTPSRLLFACSIFQACCSA
jgi:hypothetical protein